MNIRPPDNTDRVEEVRGVQKTGNDRSPRTAEAQPAAKAIKASTQKAQAPLAEIPSSERYSRKAPPERSVSDMIEDLRKSLRLNLGDEKRSETQEALEKLLEEQARTRPDTEPASED